MLEQIVFQVAGTVDMIPFISETILAAVALGVIISLINMGSARE